MAEKERNEAYDAEMEELADDAGYPPVDPVEAAVAAGLYYVMDGEPGFTRRERHGTTEYLDLKGQPISGPRHLKRIKALVIPPAWKNVWICCRPNGHIQATGRDQKGRKQYRYHPDWNAVRSLTKFGRVVQFGEALPALRAQVDQDLRRPGLTREKVTALVIRLLEQTLIRIGNQEYARQNHSYGLTTLLDDHITVEGAQIKLNFIGKRGKPFDLNVRDRRLAQLVKRCQELPGQRLFQYLDEAGQCCQSVTSGDVNAYLRAATGQDFTAKDFRTWGGSLLAAFELYQLGPAESEKAAEKHIGEVIKTVSGALGNTPAVCRKYYVHPAVLAAYRDGSLFEIVGQILQAAPDPGPDGDQLSAAEQAVLQVFKTVRIDPALV